MDERDEKEARKVRSKAVTTAMSAFQLVVKENKTLFTFISLWALPGTLFRLWVLPFTPLLDALEINRSSLMLVRRDGTGTGD